MIIIFETLNLTNLFLIFLKFPFFKKNIYYFDCHSTILLKLINFFLKKKFIKIHWKFHKMKSKNGTNLFWYIQHFELENVLLNIISIINKKKSLNNPTS